MGPALNKNIQQMEAEEELKIKIQNYNSQQKYDQSIGAVSMQVSKFNLPYEGNGGMPVVSGDDPKELQP